MRLQRVDRVMRAGEDEHLLLAIGRETVGEPDRKIGRQRMAGAAERGETGLDHFVPRFGELQPPRRFGRRPEFSPGIHDCRGDVLRG